MEVIFIFILGLLVGSFLNVLIDRLPNGENPFKGRSHCDFCKKTLLPLELIPLVSFAIQGGKSKCCKKSLTLRMPFVELLTGLLFVVTYFYSFHAFSLSNLLLTLFLLVIFCSFIVIVFVDIKHQIIPDEMVISILISTFFYRLLMGNLLLSFVSGIGAFLVLLSIFLFTKGKGMGFGDVKLAFGLGMFLGFPQIIVGMYLAFLTGAFVSLILILVGKKKLKTKIAFGPFLILGAFLSFVFGDTLLRFYLSLLG